MRAENLSRQKPISLSAKFLCLSVVMVISTLNNVVQLSFFFAKKKNNTPNEEPLKQS
jgi:hypothetical protein